MNSVVKSKVRDEGTVLEMNNIWIQSYIPLGICYYFSNKKENPRVFVVKETSIQGFFSFFSWNLNPADRSFEFTSSFLQILLHFTQVNRTETWRHVKWFKVSAGCAEL